MFFLPQTTYLKWGIVQSIQTVLYDPYFNYTTFLLNGESISTSSQNSTFIDSSTYGHTIGSAGSPDQNSYTPYAPNDWSVYFNGTSRLSAGTAGVDFQFGTGNFTIEAWVNPTNYTVNKAIYSHSNSTTHYIYFGINTSGRLFLIINNGASITSLDSFIPLNTWTHVAVTRESTATNGIKFFVNGILVDTGTSSFNFSDTTLYNPSIGGTLRSTLEARFSGYISNLRVIKGQAIYFDTFTPPISALTNNTIGATDNTVDNAITGTVSLLACQGNTFKDNSPTPKTIVPAGLCEISNFNPFRRYVNSGNSFYFDGLSGRIYAGANTDFVFGNGDFTIELWFNPTQLLANDNHTMVSYNPNPYGLSYSGIAWTTWINVDRIRGYICNGNNFYKVDYPMTGLQLNRWYHFAFVRDNGVLKIFVDGVAGETLAANHTINNPANSILYVGYVANDNPNTFRGYISNIRIVKGQALYTGSFTPPSGELKYDSVGTTGVNVANSITGTVSLVICQDPIYSIDNSTTTKSIGIVGNVAPSKNSPFLNDLWVNYNYSTFFNQKGDDLTYTSSGDFAIGSTFTIEFWVYLTTSRTTRIVGTFTGSSVAGSWSVGLFNRFIWITETNTAGDGNEPGFRTTTQIPLSTWTHVAISRVTTTTRIYFNGVNQSIQSNSSTAYGSLNYTGALIINESFFADRYLEGYLSNLRIVKGQALYTGTTSFTPPSSKLNRFDVGTSGTGVANSITGTVVLLTLQDPTFVDNSYARRTATIGGTPLIVKKLSPFDPRIIQNPYTPIEYSPSLHGGSIYFNGSTDRCFINQNTAFEFGTGDFTVEFWVKFNSTASVEEQLIVYCTSPSIVDLSSVAFGTARLSTGILRFSIAYGGANSIPLDSTFALVPHTWYHVSAARQSSTFRLFINGVLQSSNNSANVSINLPTNRVLNIGYYASNFTRYLDGYLSDIRIVKGTAVYTTNFTPPSAPLEAIAGTSLLLKGDNGAILDYTNKNIVTIVGNTSASSTVTKFGSKSIYFDGVGDYLQVPETESIILTTSTPFTIEMWVYPTTDSYTTARTILSKRNATAGQISYSIYLEQTTGYIYINYSGNAYKTTTKLTANQWNHLAMINDTDKVSFYKDGTQIGSLSTISLTNYSNSSLYFGHDLLGSGGLYFQGYMDDIRITKGVARYSGTSFTVPSKTHLLK